MATNSNRSSGSQHNSRGVTQGTTLVGPRSGLPIDEIVDGGGVRRLAVDAAVTLESAVVNVDLDVIDDGVHIGDLTTGFTLKIESDGSVNVNTEVDAADGDNIAISAHPNPLFAEFADTISTTSFEEIFSYTSASNSTRLLQIEVTISAPALVRLKIGGIVKRERRISPTERNAVFYFKEHRPLASGTPVTIEAKIDRFFTTKAPYATFTSMEGYLI